MMEQRGSSSMGRHKAHLKILGAHRARAWSAPLAANMKISGALGLTLKAVRRNSAMGILIKQNSTHLTQILKIRLENATDLKTQMRSYSSKLIFLKIRHLSHCDWLRGLSRNNNLTGVAAINSQLAQRTDG
jgi:hypothetical protein